MSEVSLLDLVNLTTGKLNSNAAVSDGKYPFFTCSVETYAINSFSFDTEALLLAGNNAEGNFSLKYYNGKFDAYQRTYVLTLEDEKTTTYKYIFYSLKTRLAELKNNSAGSATRFLTLSILKDIKIQLPPLPEQKAIADVLSALDDKIDLLQRQNETLEKMAETLFRQWFIEEAKEDWEELPLSAIATFTNGLACQKFPPKNGEIGLPVLKIKELTSGITVSSDRATAEVKSECIVHHGDVIFAWSASLMVKIWSGETCVLNQHLFNVQSEQFPKWFYYEWCKYYLREFIAIANSHATTMGHIKRNDLDEAMVNIPSEFELLEMNKIMIPNLNRIILNLKQIQTLQSLRDILLPKLMSGEVRVKLD
ncbi:MAG TPA: restriction endonuclease subunit S [Cerasibacillus sp.]|uniref:restriction endonuclease subunit S n=1 Tax=Cerasibacillus sp. TaxID=2498711 RepID=UPI002F3F40DE